MRLRWHGLEQASRDLRTGVYRRYQVLQKRKLEHWGERLLAEVDQKKNKIIQETRATLEANLAKAVADQAQIRREVDTYKIAKIAEGQAALSAAQHRARELQGELDAKYQAKQAEIAAFRTQPVERVMEKLGEKLKGVTISIQPWASDATPSRIIHQGARDQ